MSRVRIEPLLAAWPVEGRPPTFVIHSAQAGEAVVELAWDPQALLAPASYSEPLRYYGSDVAFEATIAGEDGSEHAISVPVQQVPVEGRTIWTMPATLWDGYAQEMLKSLRSSPATSFQRSIYYRVRLQPEGSETATVWPSDTVIGDNPDAPHLGILPASASPPSDELDQNVLGAMGGVASITNFWGAVLTQLRRHLPASSEDRESLVLVLDHPLFGSDGTDLLTRAKILKLWLLAGRRRRDLPELLGRTVRADGGSIPAISQRDLTGEGTLLDNLLGLHEITPHPEMVGAPRGSELVNDVLTEVLDPNGQVGGAAGDTYGAAAVQTLLMSINAAEFVRLQLGLLSEAARARLASGAEVILPEEIFQLARHTAAPPFVVRTNAELAFQAMVLAHALGGFPVYDPVTQPESSTGIFTVFCGALERGLTAAQLERALEGILNLEFASHSSGTPQALSAAFLNELGSAAQPLPLLLSWDGPENRHGQAVAALRRDGGRLLYRNPRYAGSHPPAGVAAGQTAENPPRRFDEPESAIESMAETDLASWMRAYFLPTGPLVAITETVYVVNAEGLNFRSEPRVSPETQIGVLRRGHRVSLLAEAAQGWWRVRTEYEDSSVEGYVASRFLVSPSDFEEAPAAHDGTIGAVHMTRKLGRRSLDRRRPFPLGEPGQPRRDASTATAKARQLTSIVEHLDVESSARFRPTASSTYCNIYAYDYCYLGGVYLPRVWWRPGAISRLSDGESVRVIYGETVRELRANNLYEWLAEDGWGSKFGWTSTESLTVLQDAANEGRVALICARNRNHARSGHICVVVPETDEHAAVRSAGAVTRPLQSQAGRTNRRYQTTRWWTSQRFDGHGFWYADETESSVEP